jgi:hypothetical protein
MHPRTLLVTALVAAASVAPRADAQPVRFGAYLGASSATISADENPLGETPEVGVDKKRRLGLQAGLWLNKPLSGAWSLQPELHFTQKGVAYGASFTEPGEPSVSGDISLDLSYLELPVLLRADLGQAGSTVRPFLLAGPILSYQTSCSIGFEIGDFSDSDDCDADGDAEINKLDVGGTVGGGLAFLLGSREVTAGLRYTQGFRNLGKDGPDAKNQNFSLLFGIAF